MGKKPAVTDTAPAAGTAENQGSEDWNSADAAAPASEFDAPVKVRCIVTTRPWTDKKALNEGEEADVPEDVAELMLKKKQVELV